MGLTYRAAVWPAQPEMTQRTGTLLMFCGGLIMTGRDKDREGSLSALIDSKLVVRAPAVLGKSRHLVAWEGGYARQGLSEATGYRVG